MTFFQLFFMEGSFLCASLMLLCERKAPLKSDKAMLHKALSYLEGDEIMLELKSCPRCKGDIRIDRDTYGWYEECIQCGYLGFLENMLEKKVYLPEHVRDSATSPDDKVLRRDDGQKEPAEALSGKKDNL